MKYNIRAEFERYSFKDFTIEAPDLTMARDLAESWIATEYPATCGELPKFDWRGQVVFVNTIPAEERPRGLSGIQFSLDQLLHRDSIRKPLRSRRVFNVQTLERQLTLQDLI